MASTSAAGRYMSERQAAVELFFRLNHARQTVDFVKRQVRPLLFSFPLSFNSWVCCYCACVACSHFGLCLYSRQRTLKCAASHNKNSWITFCAYVAGQSSCKRCP